MKATCHFILAEEKMATCIIVPLSTQTNTHDVGVLAIVIASSILHGVRPSKIEYVQGEMRTHIFQ